MVIWEVTGGTELMGGPLWKMTKCVLQIQGLFFFDDSMVIDHLGAFYYVNILLAISCMHVIQNHSPPPPNTR